MQDFTEEELKILEYWKSKGTPLDENVDVQRVIGEVERETGIPLRITSTSRPPDKNKKTGGGGFSTHISPKGMAADFSTKHLTQEQIDTVSKALAIRGLRFIDEKDRKSSSGKPIIQHGHVDAVMLDNIEERLNFMDSLALKQKKLSEEELKLLQEQESQYKKVKELEQQNRQDSMKKKKYIERIVPIAQRDFGGKRPPAQEFDEEFFKVISDPSRTIASNEPTAEELDQIAKANEKIANEKAAESEEIAVKKQEVDQSAKNLEDTVPEGMSPPPPSAPKNPESTSSDFKDALMFFAPQALGMALGAAFEGTQGAIEGAEQAGKLRDAYNDFNFKKMEVSQKLADAKQNFQVMSDYVDEDGRLITFDKTTNKFYNMDGNPLDTSRIRNLKNERSQTYAGMQERHLNLKEAQAGDVSDKQTEFFAQSDLTQGLMDEASKSIDLIPTGNLSGTLEQFKAKFGAADPRAVVVDNLFKRSNAEYRRYISGTASSDQERAELEDLQPRINEPLETIKAKMKALSIYVALKKQTMGGAIIKGQPLRADAVKRLLNKAKVEAGIGLDVKISRQALIEAYKLEPKDRSPEQQKLIEEDKKRGR